MLKRYFREGSQFALVAVYILEEWIADRANYSRRSHKVFDKGNFPNWSEVYQCGCHAE
jgi:hypothetical protein